jgi:hypothetical protein
VEVEQTLVADHAALDASAQIPVEPVEEKQTPVASETT